MTAQTASQAVGRNQNGSLDNAVKAVVQIFWSKDKEPEVMLMSAIETDALPDQTGLDLAEVFGEIVGVSNLDNLVEIVTSLCEKSVISTLTEQILLQAIIEVATQEKVGQELSASLQPPALTGRAALIKAATELQRQFGAVLNIPAEKLTEIRGSVEKLPSEEFASLRQLISSLIVAQAELDVDSRQLDVTASLEVVEILLGQRQSQLTAAIFSTYEVLHRNGFRLQDRDASNRPLATIRTVTLIRNRFRVWLDSHKEQLGKEESERAEKSVHTLERFLLSAAHESVQEAIRKDLSARLRERIIRLGVMFIDSRNNEQVEALPQTKEEALEKTSEHLAQVRNRLATRLQLVSTRPLAEANTVLKDILAQYSLCAMWQQGLSKLEGSDYDLSDQKPNLTTSDKKELFFETERKKLDSIRLDIEEQIEKSRLSEAKASIQKLNILLAVTVRKIEELDYLIAQERPKSACTTSNGIPLPPIPPITTSPIPSVPLMVPMPSPHAKEANYHV